MTTETLSNSARLAAAAFQAVALPDVIEARELAERLRVPRSALVRELRRGRIPGRRIGRRWVISRAALLHWLAEPEVDLHVVDRDGEGGRG